MTEYYNMTINGTKLDTNPFYPIDVDEVVEILVKHGLDLGARVKADLVETQGYVQYEQSDLARTIVDTDYFVADELTQDWDLDAADIAAIQTQIDQAVFIPEADFLAEMGASDLDAALAAFDEDGQHVNDSFADVVLRFPVLAK